LDEATVPQRKRIESSYESARDIDEATISRPTLAQAHQDGFLGIAKSRELEDDMSMFMSMSMSMPSDLPDSCRPEIYKDFNDVLDCLSHIKEPNKEMWAARRSCTLKIFNQQVLEQYASLNLVLNSIDTNYELDECYDFDPYQFYEGPTLEQLTARLETEESIGTFTAELIAEVMCFNDGHTALTESLLSGTYFYPPIDVESRLDENGVQAFYVSDPQAVIIKRKDFASEVSGTGEDPQQEHAGKMIKTINGIKPLEYYLNVVECDGWNKDEGTRLNLFLERGAMLPRLIEGGLPANGEFNVEFADGSSMQSRWGAKATSFSMDLDDMLDYLLPADNDAQQFFDFLGESGINNICSDEISAAPSLFAPRQVDDSKRLLSGEGDPLRHKTSELHGRALQVDSCISFFADEDINSKVNLSNRQNDVCTKDEATGATLCIVCKVEIEFITTATVSTVLMESKTVAVFKMEPEFPVDNLIWMHALKVAAELAKMETNEELIIDVIGNLGGSINAGYIMNDYLYRGNANAPSFARPVDACEWYDFIENPTMKYLIEMKADQSTWVYPDDEDLKIIADLLHKLFVEETFLKDEVLSIKQSLTEEALHQQAESCIDIIEKAASDDGEPTDEEKGEVKPCLELLGDVASTLNPYAPSNIKPAGTANFMSLTHPEKVFQAPNWDFFLQKVPRQFGTQTQYMTSKAFIPDECSWYMKEVNGSELPIKLDPIEGGLRSIKYITDGVCGSTCSVSTTRPFVDGLSTVITFGGVQGKRHDITTFNGGNVNTQAGSVWKDFALEVILTAAITEPLVPAEAVLLPMPINVNVTSAQRLQYPKAMGDNAMPREFYKIPSSYQLPIWTSMPLDISALNGSSLAFPTLMKVYTEAAIKPDKPLKQYCVGTEYYADEEGKKYPRCETLDADVDCDKYCGNLEFDAGDSESQQECKCVDLSEACAEGTVGKSDDSSESGKAAGASFVSTTFSVVASILLFSRATMV
jgi:hypothetical protein